MTISLRTGVYLPAFKTAPQRATGATATAQETLRKLTEAAASPETKAALTKLGEQVEAARTLATSMKAARDEARSAVKQQAHATVQRLKEEYKLIRKLWAHNPAEMARQLGRVAKELKRAVTSYVEAARANIERVADLGPEADVKADAAGKTAHADAGSDPTPDEKHSDAPEKNLSDTDAALPARLALSPRAELADALKAYARQAPADVFAKTAEERRQEFESAEMEAGGDLEFSREVKGFIKALREELQLAKIRAGLIKDRATEDAFKETQKTLTELDKDIADMEGDIIDAFPKLAQTRTV